MSYEFNNPVEVKQSTISLVSSIRKRFPRWVCVKKISENCVRKSQFFTNFPNILFICVALINKVNCSYLSALSEVSCSAEGRTPPNASALILPDRFATFHLSHTQISKLFFHSMITSHSYFRSAI